jgi:uncharacterized protein (UPF0210 family)
MEIRSVTLFCDPDRSPMNFADFLFAARHAFPVRVQSLRLATIPFPEWLPFDEATDAARNFAGAWQAGGIDYVSVGPARLVHDDSWLGLIPGLLVAGDGLFVSVEIATPDGHLDVQRCWNTARLIRQVSAIMPDGFGNLFMGALAGCGPGHPFLPASYHAGGEPCFAIAVESADVALEAIQGAASLAEARERLVRGIESASAAILPEAMRLSVEFGIAFKGLDFSLAPYPTEDKSLGSALEALGVSHSGAPGGLFAAAFITEAIDRAQFPRTGFSGLMLPVLEDVTLARRAAAGELSLNDLLLYSAVCGVGLDTIPLPGDIDEATLAGILLDTAALSARLRKPLVARLMPLPGLQSGEPARFSFEYFAPGGVMRIPGTGIAGLLKGQASLQIDAYHHFHSV